jgi:hypothetical protein
VISGGVWGFIGRYFFLTLYLGFSFCIACEMFVNITSLAFLVSEACAKTIASNPPLRPPGKPNLPLRAINKNAHSRRMQESTLWALSQVGSAPCGDFRSKNAVQTPFHVSTGFFERKPPQGGDPTWQAPRK